MDNKKLEIIAIVLFAFLLYFSVKTILPIFDAILLGVVFAYMVRPLSSYIKKNISYKGVAVFIAMTLVVVPLLFIGLFTITEIVKTFKASDVVNIVESAFSNINVLIDSVTDDFFVFFGVDFDSLSQNTIDSISEKVAELSNIAYIFIFDVTKKIPLLLFKVMLAAVLAFYFLRDGEKVNDKILQLVPDIHKEQFSHFLKSSDVVFQAVIIGYLMKAIFTMVLAIFVFYVFDVPNPILLGIATGILDFIPVIGPWIVEILLLVWYLQQGQYSYAISLFLASYFFISFIPEMYIRPRISGGAANIHPAIILIGIIGGLFAFGVMGIILGPLFLGVVIVALRIYFYKEPYNNIQFGYKDSFLNLFRGWYTRGDKKR